jgi:hypothetical protein
MRHDSSSPRFPRDGRDPLAARAASEKEGTYWRDFCKSHMRQNHDSSPLRLPSDARPAPAGRLVCISRRMPYI